LEQLSGFLLLAQLNVGKQFQYLPEDALVEMFVAMADQLLIIAFGYQFLDCWGQ
jgi:hypothetical protein